MNESSSADPDGLRFRIELESPDEGIRRVHEVRAASMEEALVKVRETGPWPTSGSGSDPSRFRVVEAAEQTATTEVRDQRNARRRHLNTIVEAGLTSLARRFPTSRFKSTSTSSATSSAGLWSGPAGPRPMREATAC
ncbi:hypothetical protein [Kribbella lupini]|uniref:Uncharacterized protein n=1 Tax=Kribbella lupini TaxID=291602 RepID=A0ABP4NHE9_9ACTN